MKTILTVVGLGLGLASGMAAADAQSLAVADDPMVFKKVDADHDGYVNREEAQSIVGLEQGFDIADANKDGQLYPAEFAVALPRTGSE